MQEVNTSRGEKKPHNLKHFELVDLSSSLNWKESNLNILTIQNVQELHNLSLAQFLNESILNNSAVWLYLTLKYFTEMPF